MILFKPRFVEPILSGQKTQTRRVGTRRWNVGAVHQVQTRMLDNSSVFARVRVLDVYREMVSAISEGDAVAEGFSSREEFVAAFCEISGVDVMSPAFDEAMASDVWVVHFELEKAVSYA